MSNNSVFAAIGYVSWSLLLLACLVTYRLVIAARKKRPINGFRPDGSDLDAIGHRLTRAHANVLETFPIFPATLLIAIMTHNAHLTNGLALWALLARITQSCVHLVSTSNFAVRVRGTFLIIQMAITTIWLVRMLHLV